MNIYIILGIVYLVYTIYNRYKSTKDNRPTMQQPGQQGKQPTEESLMDRLKRLAQEMEERERRAQQEAQMQTQGSTRQETASTEQEYPEEWIVTETGTKVHDLEGRRIKEEYLQSREDNNNSREATIKEEYLASRENQKSRDELAAEAYGESYVEGPSKFRKKSISTAPAKARTTSTTMQKRHKTHPIAKSIFGDTGARKAMIIKEIFDRPRY